MTIRFVYFDLGNVLATFDVDRACNNVAQRFGVDPEAVRHGIWSSGVQDRFEHGHEDEESFAAVVRECLSLTHESAATEELLSLLSDIFEPVDGMADIVDAVRQSGTRLGILSNTCAAHWRWIVAQDYAALHGRFDAVILSYEVGSMKPDVAIYHAAQVASGVAPDEILFFDDRVDNVDAALQRGWNASRFTDAKTAGEVLRYHGVLR